MGEWVARLRAHGFEQVIGIEHSADVVEAVNRVAPELDVRVGDILALGDFPAGSVDVYLSFGVVEHFEEGPAAALVEAFRVLSPGGFGVVSVPHYGRVRRAKARLHRYPTAPSLPFYQYGLTAEDLSQEAEQRWASSRSLRRRKVRIECSWRRVVCTGG